MLDIKFIRENTEAIQKIIALRGMHDNIDEFIQLDNERRKLARELEDLKRYRKQKTRKIAELIQKKIDIKINLEEMKQLSIQIKKIERGFNEIDKQLNDIVARIPNIMHNSVPKGVSLEENDVIREWGKKTNFPFKPLTHWELGEFLGILDFERSVKITKSRFALYFDTGARLERALINFMLDYHTKNHKYTEILTPFIVNAKSAFGTAHLPMYEDELFRCDREELYLISTAEIPVTNIHRDEIIDEEKLPLNYVAYSPCFRKEAGSYGKDTKGLIRRHQFNKVELVKFVKPENSYEELEKLTNDAETILKLLKLPYRVVSLCSGTLDPTATKSYDIEVWIPTQNCYREISTCSNYEEYQARRIDAKYRPSFGKPEYIHTLNGSGLAIGRTVVAILENFQNIDRSVDIPEVLWDYMGGVKKLTPISW
jgi:seryl-tRNA synthetase